MLEEGEQRAIYTLPAIPSVSEGEQEGVYMPYATRTPGVHGGVPTCTHVYPWVHGGVPTCTHVYPCTMGVRVHADPPSHLIR